MAAVQIDLETAPALVPPVGTLLDVASVLDRPNLGWLGTEGLYESLGCVEVGARAGDPCGAPVDKDTEAPGGWVDGTAFSAYGLLSCKAVGLDYEGYEERAREAYTLSESRAVERGVMEIIFGVAGAGAVDLTGAATRSAQDGLALLEGYAGRYYGGVPTIHAPRAIGSLLTARGALDLDGRVLRTKLGSKVAAGGGYYASLSPAGVAAPEGEGWMYVTGEVVIRRGPLNTYKAFNTENNDALALAERSYLVTTDCLLAAVRVEAVFA